MNDLSQAGQRNEQFEKISLYRKYFTGMNFPSSVLARRRKKCPAISTVPEVVGLKGCGGSTTMILRVSPKGKSSRMVYTVQIRIRDIPHREPVKVPLNLSATIFCGFGHGICNTVIRMHTQS
jgi:hypothetical protein